MRRTTRGALASVAVTTFGVALRTVAPAASTACDGHECDMHASEWGCRDPNVSPSAPCCDEGYMVDDDHWATTLQYANWLPFRSYEQLTLHFGAFTGTRIPDEGLSSILIAPAQPEGPDAPFPDAPFPDGGFDTTTLASGNMGEWNRIGPGQAMVENATCSPTIVRVVVGFPHIEGGVPEEFIGPCQQKSGVAAGSAGGGG